MFDNRQKLFIPILFSLVVSFGLYFLQNNIANAVSAFYTDGYESANMYAVADNNKLNTSTNKTETVTKKGYTIDRQTQTIDGKGKKTIYNTIIIKRKKDQTNQKKVEVKKVEKKVEDNKSLENVTKYARKRNTFIRETETTSEESDFWKKVKNPFYALKPDRYYFYAFAGYGFSTPANLKISAEKADGEVAIANVDAMNAKTNWKGSGLGAIAGLKIYIGSWYIAPFIGPEFFYTKLNMNEKVARYNSYQHLSTNYYNPVTSTLEGTGLILPIDMSFSPTDIFGATIRGGITFWNFLSIFAKASVGGMRGNIKMHPMISDINWTQFLDPNNASIPEGFEAFKDRTILVISDPEYRDYRGDESISHKVAFTYALGFGAEMHFWNQRFTIRFDYDHYFINSIFNLSNTRYTRWAAEGGTELTNIHEGTKWKVKTNFGVLKLNFGIAI